MSTLSGTPEWKKNRARRAALKALAQAQQAREWAALDVRDRCKWQRESHDPSFWDGIVERSVAALKKAEQAVEDAERVLAKV